MGNEYLKRLQYSRQHAAERRRELHERGWKVVTLALSPEAVAALEAVKSLANLKSRESAVNLVLARLPMEQIAANISDEEKAVST